MLAVTTMMIVYSIKRILHHIIKKTKNFLKGLTQNFHALEKAILANAFEKKVFNNKKVLIAMDTLPDVCKLDGREIININDFLSVL